MLTNSATYGNNSVYDSFAPNFHLPRASVLVAPIVAREMDASPFLVSTCPVESINLDCFWTVVVLLVGVVTIIASTAVDRFGPPCAFSLLSLRHSWNELTTRRQSNLNCID